MHGLTYDTNGMPDDGIAIGIGEDGTLRTDPNVVEHLYLMQTMLYGEAIGDALGVPYASRGRDTFTCEDMIDDETHGRPAGTYSDATALTLATLDSLLCNDGKVDPDDMRSRFLDWLDDGRYSADGAVFDVDGTTGRALRAGHGMDGERDTGSGSLMRVAPCALFDLSDDEIRAASAVTHAHPTSMDACVRYVRIVRDVLDHEPLRDALAAHGFDGLWDKPRAEIESDGFAPHTLEAAMWCLCTTASYADCVRAAVELGGDTVATAATAGALAAVIHGFEDEGGSNGVPEAWMERLRGQRRFLDVILGGPLDAGEADGEETESVRVVDPLRGDALVPGVQEVQPAKLVMSTASEAVNLFEQGQNLCEQAQGEPDAEYRRELFSQAADCFEQSFRNGMNEAAAVVGMLHYEHGLDESEGDALAREWFERGLEAGDTDCACYLGDMARDGRGMEQDWAKAFDYYERAFDAACELFDLHEIHDMAVFAAINLRLGECYERKLDGRMPAPLEAGDRDGEIAFLHYRTAAAMARRVVAMGGASLSKDLELAQAGAARTERYAAEESTSIVDPMEREAE